MGGKKFAVLLCAEDPEYVKMKYGGYFGVFLRMLGEEGETWDVYKVACGEFPDDEEIKTFDGFVITGSCNDAHGNDVWILKLLILLQKLNSMKKKILGICFGHQVPCFLGNGQILIAIKLFGLMENVPFTRYSTSNNESLLKPARLPRI